ncbi:MAG: hypothetical protein O9345_16180 [Burkholderiaceae bacterium]|nr:hypothetical protein [Burkholderiales bacterium]MCZ8339664.1 hypothetical protein [Burkholderiaceae bacterium]
MITCLRSLLRRPPAPVLGSPMNDERVRELQRRIAEKRAAAIAELGDRWLLHPSRRIR